MPIARELRHLYRTASWKAVCAIAKKRAKDRCENCRRPNKAEIWTRSGEDLMIWSVDALRWRDQEGDVVRFGSELWAMMSRFRLRHITVKCGGAHLNHTPGDDRPENVRWLCGWCHIMHDRPEHKRTRSIHKDQRRPLLQEAIA